MLDQKIASPAAEAILVCRLRHKQLQRGHYGDVFSPRGSIDTLRLKPGAKYHHVVSLLETLPQEKRLPGTYIVQATYEYDGLTVASEPLAVELRAEK